MHKIEEFSKMISWSKWRDPLGRNQHEFEYVPEKDVENYDNNQDALYDDEDDDDDNPENPTPVVITPLGILPLKPFNDPTKVFNFWLGETNFDINMDVAAILDTTPGVEILDIFTRYKFRIAIGNNFSFQYVRQLIEQALDASPQPKDKSEQNMRLDPSTQTQVQQLIQMHLKKFNFWAIYVLPNGQVDMSSSYENSVEFSEKLDLYYQTRQLAGGAIFKYDDQLV